MTTKTQGSPKLRVFKYNAKKHADDFARLCLYFNRLWQWSFPQKGKDQAIPLSRLNRTVSTGRNEPLVKIAANIWFEQQTRGDSVTKTCSKWKRREHPRMNKQVLAALKELQDENITVTEELWSVASEKNTVEINLKTTITFKTNAEAAKFQEHIGALIAEAEAIRIENVETDQKRD